MKNLFFFIGIYVFPVFVFAQSNSQNDDATYKEFIYTDEINKINVFASDTFNQIIQNKLKKTGNLIVTEGDHPIVYVTNKSENKYLKVWGGPDLGYGWFYSIGYTVNKRCDACGTYVGKQGDIDFIINNDIKLGDDIKEVWPKANLSYFRKFKFKGVDYYYFEKGIKTEIPFNPYQVFYYKFMKEKLIEIGFGYGMIGINPML